MNSYTKSRKKKCSISCLFPVLSMTLYDIKWRTRYRYPSTFAAVDSITLESRWALATVWMIILNNPLKNKKIRNRKNEREREWKRQTDIERHSQHKLSMSSHLVFSSSILHCWFHNAKPQKLLIRKADIRA